MALLSGNGTQVLGAVDLWCGSCRTRAVHRVEDGPRPGPIAARLLGRGRGHRMTCGCCGTATPLTPQDAREVLDRPRRSPSSGPISCSLSIPPEEARA